MAGIFLLRGRGGGHEREGVFEEFCEEGMAFVIWQGEDKGFEGVVGVVYPVRETISPLAVGMA